MWSSTDDNAKRPAQGTITLITGCMFAGKTQLVLSMLRRVPESKRMAFKHVIDDRYQIDAIVSHNGDRLSAMRIASPAELIDHAHAGIDLIAIEEAHFFDSAIVDAARTLAWRGVDVILTGLDFDTWGTPIPIIEKLSTIADRRIVRQATCARCGAVADRTHRLTPIIDGNLIGGSESFEPRCQSCWSPPPEPRPRYTH